MDENVVFNKDTSQQSAGTGTPPEQSVDPNQPASDGQTTNPASGDQAAQGTAQEQPAATDQAVPIEGEQPQAVEGQSTDAPMAEEGGAPPADGEPPTEETPPPPAGLLGNGRLKKILIGVGLLILIIFLVFLFIPKKQGVKNVKLVWWGLWEDNQAVQAVINDFERQNPHITVEYIKQDPQKYRERLVTRIQNDTGPDIFRYHSSWMPMVSSVLLPLPSDVITPEEFKKTYYPVMQDDLVVNGGIYGIPMGADTLALFVNPELLKAAGVDPPKNWDDFKKAAIKMTVKDENGEIKTAGAAMGTYENVTHASDILALLFVQQGIDMKKFLEGTIENKTEAIEFYVSFTKDDKSTWDNTLDESLLAFSKGTVAMIFGYSWDIFELQKLKKDLPLAVYEVPELYGKNKTIASYWVEGVSAKSQNQKEALLFMKHLSKKETIQKFYAEASKLRSFGEPPARIDLADTVKDNELVYPFVSQLSNSSSSFFSSDTHDGDGGINFLSGIYLGNAINTVLEENSSLETIIKTLDQGVEQAFMKYAQ